MSLQRYLVEAFNAWSPEAPRVVNRTKGSITLTWGQPGPFHFVGDQLLYRLERNSKLPPWVVEYRGGKTTKLVDNLAPRHPYRFRLRFQLMAEAVPTLEQKALDHYGDENAVYDHLKGILHKDSVPQDVIEVDSNTIDLDISDGRGDEEVGEDTVTTKVTKSSSSEKQRWLESRYSEDTWASTDTDGTSAVCFCMAVRCGYIKQVQVMLEERPALIGIANSSNGFTPLATAVWKGDINTVKFLLAAGAELEQRSLAGQTPLQLAVLARLPLIVELLLEKGADFKVPTGLSIGNSTGRLFLTTDSDTHVLMNVTSGMNRNTEKFLRSAAELEQRSSELLLEKRVDFKARDVNGMQVEHYAVDSCDLDMLRLVLDRGGDVGVRDNNGWTPLFRALCQGASTAVIEELVLRGSDLDVCDHVGLPLTSAARLLRNRHGRSRDSVLRLVDSQYPHEKALANFTRLTKKIYTVQSILK